MNICQQLSGLVAYVDRSNMSGMHWEYEFNFHLHGVYIVEDSRALASVVDYSRSLLSSTYGLWKK